MEKARTFLGPSGAWWLRERLEGRVPLRTGYHLVDARPAGDRILLAIEGERREEVTYDHVIAGTGFHLDLDRLEFISSELRAGLRLAGGVPALSRSFESSVRGLFFVGSPAAPSLGPSMRFIAGTHFTARRLAKRLKVGDRAGPESSSCRPRTRLVPRLVLTDLRWPAVERRQCSPFGVELSG